jgi:hypothetical protein
MLALCVVLSLAIPPWAGPKRPAAITVYGSGQCPPGFALVYAGSVVYLNLYGPNIVADGLCWQTVPPDPPPQYSDTPRFSVIGSCAVCAR